MSYEYLFLDFETYSLANLKKVGLDNYAKHPSTGISMLGWAADHEEIDAWLPHVGPTPKKLLDLVHDPKVIKVSWNTPFEYSIVAHKMGFVIPLAEWRDPIVLAHNISLPGKLDAVAKILKMKELKDERGEELKKMFCMPVSMGGDNTLFGISPPLFRDHVSHPREFAEYILYCKQDVRAERDLWYRLLKIEFPERDWQGWLLDQKINLFGMPGNREMAEKAFRISERYITEQKARLKAATGLENPNSDTQMKEWVATRGFTGHSLQAKYVTVELNNPKSTITKECREALVLRAESKKTSYKKFGRFLEMLSSDDRLRFQFRYMGAPRTGRWASGGGEDPSVQVQNMARGEKAVKKALMRALELVNNEDYDGIVKEFPKQSVIAVVITLIRSLFQAKKGKKIVVADLNAIEYRVLMWVAWCMAGMDVCRKEPKDGGDPYLDFAVDLYGIPYAQLWAEYDDGNGDPEKRQNSKPPVLGAGYALGGGELYVNENGDTVWGGLMGYARNVCGVEMPHDLAHKSIKVYRDKFPQVPQLWTDLEEAFKQVLRRGGVIKVGEVTWDKKAKEWVEHPSGGKGCVLTFRRKSMEGGGFMIRMELPSGRALHYLNATIEQKQLIGKKTGQPYNVDVLFYDGVEHSATQNEDGSAAKKHVKWGRVKTYGGKLTENAVQAIARDVLLHGMFEADDLGFHIWGTFHDELACEEDDDMFGLGLNDLIDCMTRVPEWTNGLTLGAAGFEGPVYRKG